MTGENDESVTLNRDESSLHSFMPPKAFIRGDDSKLGSQPEYLSDPGRTVSEFAPEIVTETDIDIPKYLSVYCFRHRDISTFPQASPDLTGAVGYYLMDCASIFPILALNLQRGDSVLDMCAAPGGKSMAMLQTLLPGTLYCNDNDRSRFSKLKGTLNTYLPPNAAIREHITVSTLDALEDFDSLHSTFDKVLIDAPCTTDRLALQDDDGNLFRRSKTPQRMQLPTLQAQILVSGILCTKPGGDVVYATCTLSPLQNDNVIEQAFDILNVSFPNVKIVVKDISLLSSELRRAGLFRLWPKCKYGQLIVPFVPNNYGPMYTCKLQRVE